MKRFLAAVLLLLLLSACSGPEPHTDLAATTWPVYSLTSALCEGTDLTIGRVISQPVSCLHDYSLTVAQMKAITQADLVILSGAGLEEFMEDALSGARETVDASAGVSLLPGEEEEWDPHIWLDPMNAKAMLTNIADALILRYPGKADRIRANLDSYTKQLDEVLAYGRTELSGLQNRDLITFHDGFAYFAEAFDLNILAAIEEEAGSEASAGLLMELIHLTIDNAVPCVFTEVNGADAAAKIVASETCCSVRSLNLMMDGLDYCEAIRQNIDTVKEALNR